MLLLSKEEQFDWKLAGALSAYVLMRPWARDLTHDVACLVYEWWRPLKSLPALLDWMNADFCEAQKCCRDTPFIQISVSYYWSIGDKSHELPSCLEGFGNRCDPMTRAIRSTLSPSWTPKTLLFRMNSRIVVQDLNYKQNEGPVYQDWAPSLETDQGRGSWLRAFVQQMTDHSCWHVKTKQSSTIVSNGLRGRLLQAELAQAQKAPKSCI